MATVTLSPLIQGLRGRVGDFVFRQRNGRTFASRLPVGRRDQPTRAQLEARDRFRMAAVYARSAFANPTRAAFYLVLATGKLTPHAIAVRDFLNAPVIDNIALGLFDGLVGDEIIITATDDTEVASVHVVLQQSGHILEQGPAQNRADDTWSYTVTSDVAAHCIQSSAELTIEVTAADRPGNKAVRTAAWLPPSRLVT